MTGLASCSPQAELLTGGINSQAVDQDPAYSGDGRYLAFTSDRRGHRDIYLFDLDGKNLIDLPGLNRNDSSQEQPALNNDGRYIVYVSNQRGRRDIFIYDRDRQTVRLLSANTKGSVANPTIKGDGSEIAFASTDGGQWKISVVTNPLQ
jgi:Tol biopolymer transport system component